MFFLLVPVALITGHFVARLLLVGAYLPIAVIGILLIGLTAQFIILRDKEILSPAVVKTATYTSYLSLSVVWGFLLFLFFA